MLDGSLSLRDSYLDSCTRQTDALSQRTDSLSVFRMEIVGFNHMKELYHEDNNFKELWKNVLCIIMSKTLFMRIFSWRVTSCVYSSTPSRRRWFGTCIMVPWAVIWAEISLLQHLEKCFIGLTCEGKLPSSCCDAIHVKPQRDMHKTQIYIHLFLFSRVFGRICPWTLCRDCHRPSEE